MSALFVFEIAIKSVIVCCAAFAALALMRRRPAIERARLLKTAFLMLLLIPIFSFAVPEPLRANIAVVGDAPATARAPESPFSHHYQSTDSTQAPYKAEEHGAYPALGNNAAPIGWLPAALYALVAACIILRLIVALARLSRLAAAARPVTEPAWRAALANAQTGFARRPRIALLSNARMPAPASWGWLRPVIVIDDATRTRIADADAVLAHEVQHVMRRDWLALILARAVSAFYWVNPLIWLMERRLVQSCEEAADAGALKNMQPHLYAEVLLQCARRASSQAQFANAMANDALVRRINAVLDAPSPSRRVRAAGAVCLLTIVFSALAPINFVRRDAAVAQDAAVVEPFAAPDNRDARARSPVVDEFRVRRAVSRFHADRADASAPMREQLDEAGVDDAYVAELAEIGFDELSLPELTLARLNDVSASTVRSYSRMGYAGLNYQQVFQYAVHDITPDFVHELSTAGYDQLSPEHLISFRVLGVNAAALRGFSELGYPALSRDQLALFAMHDVTPSYIRSIPAADRRSPEALVRRRMRERGLPD